MKNIHLWVCYLHSHCPSRPYFWKKSRLHDHTYGYFCRLIQMLPSHLLTWMAYTSIEINQNQVSNNINFNQLSNSITMIPQLWECESSHAIHNPNSYILWMGMCSFFSWSSCLYCENVNMITHIYSIYCEIGHVPTPFIL